jgi:hypothetical protein
MYERQALYPCGSKSGQLAAVATLGKRILSALASPSHPIDRQEDPQPTVTSRASTAIGGLPGAAPVGTRISAHFKIGFDD